MTKGQRMTGQIITTLKSFREQLKIQLDTNLTQ